MSKNLEDIFPEFSSKQKKEYDKTILQELTLYASCIVLGGAFGYLNFNPQDAYKTNIILQTTLGAVGAKQSVIRKNFQKESAFEEFFNSLPLVVFGSAFYWIPYFTLNYFGN